jgi:hypothetical protein
MEIDCTGKIMVTSNLPCSPAMPHDLRRRERGTNNSVYFLRNVMYSIVVPYLRDRGGAGMA